MIYRNGFFQLVIKAEAVFVKIFPPRTGGQPLNFEELTGYLDGKKLEYDLKALHERVHSAKEPELVKICEGTTYAESEKLILRAAPDNLTMYGRFIPQSTGGAAITKAEILSDLKAKGVRFGVDEEAIDRYLANREYCTDLVLVRGKEPRHGSDAEITYRFSLSRSSKPKQKEDGSVDFHDLDMIARVAKGDVLAVLKPEDPGEAGSDIYGNPVKPRTVKRLVLKHGKNIHLSEDGLTMYSDVSGHVSLEEDRVFVSNIYEVAANVDNSTGDIEYDGNVEVKGNVLTGFYVRASGDVIVNGVVEGAKIIAGGQIVLRRGIQGMNKGYLEAGGNIIAKFIENSEVKAGGYVTTDALMHSQVVASGDILVESKKGFVTGGAIRSGSQVRIKTAGSTMGTATTIEVGINPEIMDEFRRLESGIEEKEKEKLQNMQIMALFKKKLEKGEKLSSDKLMQLKTASSSYKRLDDEQVSMKARYEELRQEIEDFRGGSIKVTGMAYPGVKIVISNAVYFVRSETHHSQFVKEGGEIRICGL